MTDSQALPPSVRIDKVSKRFGATLALDEVSLDIHQKELMAILGPNGAGKSTLITILCTLLQADSGTCTVAGFDVAKRPRQARRKLGVVFQEPSLDTRLTVQENLEFHARVYQVPAALRKQRISEMLEMVELTHVRDRMVRTLSAGMKRRVEIARALIHDSSVVILDEPTVGLDAQSRARIWDYLHKLRQEREITLIVTTHYIEEVDSCDRVCIIDRGKVLALDTPTNLKSEYGEQVIRVTPLDGKTADEIRARFPNTLTTPEGEIVVTDSTGNASQSLLAEFGQRLRSMNVERSSLESVFLNLTGRAVRDDEAERTRIGVEGRQPGQEPRM
jgi:ABC-2 type transport system ATP-binding protein